MPNKFSDIGDLDFDTEIAANKIKADNIEIRNLKSFKLWYLSFIIAIPKVIVKKHKPKNLSNVWSSKLNGAIIITVKGITRRIFFASNNLVFIFV